MISTTLRMGTRGSLLARAQSETIAKTIEAAHPGLVVARCVYKTMGDKILDRPLHEFGGKGLFTKEIEEDLIARKIDFIVHSCKDVPVTMPLVDQDELTIGAIPKREDPRDALVCLTANALSDLPRGARVGTGSLRRRCQLLAHRPDLQIDLLRGNVDTRVGKCRNGQYAAVLLAMAGLRRSGLFEEAWMTPIPEQDMLPAAGQGALLIQCRRDDPTAKELLMGLNDPDTATAVDLERRLVAALNGDCHSPIAALATVRGEEILMHAVVGTRGGNTPVIRASAAGGNAERVLNEVLKSLLDQHALELLETGTSESLCKQH
ncbi:hydroxymethylbilane synthase [soil metagenome]